MSKSLRGSLLLLLTATIWGLAFVAQRVGAAHLGGLWFNGIRLVLAGIELTLLSPLLEKKGLTSRPTTPADKKVLLVGGALCGLCLCVASNLQQIGLAYTTAGKGGFITSLYVILVPLFTLVAGKRVAPHLWICVAGAAIGLYLLCMTESLTIAWGDLMVLLCAVCFSFHILFVDYYAPKTDGLQLSRIQFLVAGAVSIVAGLLTDIDGVSLAGIGDCLIPLLYAGLLSCGVGYTLQVIAQKDTNPTVASMVMCLESVFALLFGCLLLGETLTMREWLGCGLMLAAVMAAQLPEKKKG